MLNKKIPEIKLNKHASHTDHNFIKTNHLNVVKEVGENLVSYKIHNTDNPKEMAELTVKFDVVTIDDIPNLSQILKKDTKSLLDDNIIRIIESSINTSNIEGPSQEIYIGVGINDSVRDIMQQAMNALQEFIGLAMSHACHGGLHGTGQPAVDAVLAAVASPDWDGNTR